jgi:hypothetical protein
MNILEVLEQEEMWYGQDGRPYRIEDMSQAHRLNVLAFLRRRAQELYAHKHWSEAEEIGRTSDGWFVGALPITENPTNWLNRQPLMASLEAAVRNHNTIDGEVITTEVTKHSCITKDFNGYCYDE